MHSCSAPKGAEDISPGDIVVDRLRELLAKGLTVTADQLPEFGWKIPLVTTCDPSPYCIPEEIFTFHPQEADIFKIFFKGTSREVRIRQIFFHTPLTAEEQQWLADFREHCRNAEWNIPLFLEPMVLRIIWLAYRKWGDNIITRSFDLAKGMVEWREGFFPLSDQEEEMKAMLDKGVMFWVGRDRSLRPLLVIKLARLSKTASPEIFKRLTIFCFEWGLRYMIIPGRVETITVLLDVRGVPLHQFPISALTDMTSTLTKQYPFRLNRMLIINDSFFVQTVWNIAKQFLTEVQQQKMLFLRTGYEEELTKEYTPWQLEKCYGGTRPEITSFYPFPIAPGPYVLGSVPREEPYRNAYRATDRVTSLGVIWEKDCRTPIQWAPEAFSVFKDLSLPLPEGLVHDQSGAEADAKELVQNSVTCEQLYAAAVAEPVAEDADAAGAAADVAAREAEPTANSEARAEAAAATALVRGGTGADASLDGAGDERNVAAQDPVDKKAADSPTAGGDISLVEPPSEANADDTEEILNKPKKLTTVDTATTPAQTEPDAQTAEHNRAHEEKGNPAVQKVGGSKCCSRCTIQ